MIAFCFSLSKIYERNGFFLRTTGDERFFPEAAPQVSDCAFGGAERREPGEALVGSDGVAEEGVEAHA